MSRVAFFMSLLSLIVSSVAIWISYQQSDTQFEVSHRDSVTLGFLHAYDRTIVLPESLKKEHYIAIPIVLLINNTGYHDTSILNYMTLLKPVNSIIVPQDELRQKINLLTLERMLVRARDNFFGQRKMLLNVRAGGAKKMKFYLLKKIKLKAYQILDKINRKLTITNALNALAVYSNNDKAFLDSFDYEFAVCITTSRSGFSCASGNIVSGDSTSVSP